MATYSEAVPFLRRLEMEQVENEPFPVYKYDGFYLMITGIGKINSAIATSYLINAYKIKNMLNIGAAGATSGNYDIGDILHIDKSLEYNDRKDEKQEHRIFSPDVLRGFKIATLSTHVNPVLDPVERLKVSVYADLVDMEGAPFIYACRAFLTGSYLFKVVTDTIDHNEIPEIIKNIKFTRDILFEFTMDKIIPGLNRL